MQRAMAIIMRLRVCCLEENLHGFIPPFSACHSASVLGKLSARCTHRSTPAQSQEIFRQGVRNKLNFESYALVGLEFLELGCYH